MVGDVGKMTKLSVTEIIQALSDEKLLIAREMNLMQLREAFGLKVDYEAKKVFGMLERENMKRKGIIKPQPKGP